MLYGLSDLVRVKQLILKQRASEAQKRVELVKLTSLLRYCEDTHCRRQPLLQYFGNFILTFGLISTGDTPTRTNCGNCDVCLDPPEMSVATDEARLALKCIHNTGQRFGPGHLARVLLGSQEKSVIALGHDKLEVYGRGKDRPSGVLWDRDRWLSLFRQLITEGYVGVDPQFGGLKLTPHSQTLLRGSEFRFRENRKSERSGSEIRADGDGPEEVEEKVKAPVVKKRGRPKKSDILAVPKEEPLPAPPKQVVDKLYALLRDRRTQIAKEEGIPAFYVFHNKTLMEMATLCPNTNESFQTIKGVTEKKIELYGEQFLDILKQFRTTMYPPGYSRNTTSNTEKE